MEQNKALVYRWFEEVWNQGRTEVIDELMAADTIAHGLGEAALRGPEGFKAFHAQFRGALPDIQITVEDVISEGDKTVARFSGTGTHLGEHLGVPPTAQPVTFTGMTITRWQDGQIVEGWNSVDFLPIFQAVGLVAPVAR